MTACDVDGPRRWFTVLPVTKTYDALDTVSEFAVVLEEVLLLPPEPDKAPINAMMAKTIIAGIISRRSARRTARLGAFNARLVAVIGFCVFTGRDLSVERFVGVLSCESFVVVSGLSPNNLCNLPYCALLKLVRIPSFTNLASILDKNDRSQSFTLFCSSRERIRACI